MNPKTDSMNTNNRNTYKRKNNVHKNNQNTLYESLMTLRSPQTRKIILNKDVHVHENDPS